MNGSFSMGRIYLRMSQAIELKLQNMVYCKVDTPHSGKTVGKVESNTPWVSRFVFYCKFVLKFYINFYYLHLIDISKRSRRRISLLSKNKEVLF